MLPPLIAAIALLSAAPRLRAEDKPSEAPADEATPNTLTDAEQKAGWKLLFDGKTLDGWHTFGRKDVRPGWIVKDGTLACVDPHNAGDIVTKDKFGWFELELDYNISEAGNSGIMYHVTDAGRAVWATGPEFQLEDNEKAADPIRCGWLYALYQAADRSHDGQDARRHQAGRRVEPRPPAAHAGEMRARHQRRQVFRIRAGQRRFQGPRGEEQVRLDAEFRQVRHRLHRACKATTAKSRSATSRSGRSRRNRNGGSNIPRECATGSVSVFSRSGRVQNNAIPLLALRARSMRW